MNRATVTSPTTTAAAAIAALVTLFTLHASAADAAMGSDSLIDRANTPERTANYSPFVGDDYPDRVFWGDTHLHMHCLAYLRPTKATGPGPVAQ